MLGAVVVITAVCILVLVNMWRPGPSKFERAMLAYREKPKLPDKVVVIIESYGNYKNLKTLLWYIFNQTVRVDSIAVVARNRKEAERLSALNFVQQSCVISRTSGLGWFIKELDDDAVFLFVFTEGVGRFQNPTFLDAHLNSPYATDRNGVVKVRVKDYLVDLQNLYDHRLEEHGAIDAD